MRRGCRPARCATSSPREPRLGSRPTRTSRGSSPRPTSSRRSRRRSGSTRSHLRPGTRIETPWSDLWLTEDDWEAAFDAPDVGTPHNEAREEILEELVTILVDQDAGDAPDDQLRKSLRQNRGLLTALNAAWPLLEPTDLVGDLWSVPAYLRMCAPWLGADQVRALQRTDPQAWTVSDLPLLDAARQRLGDPQASQRRRQQEAVSALEREQVAAVIDDLIAADDDHEGVVTMLRHPDIRLNLVDEDAVPRADPDLLAGPFAHIVVDEAQELTDAEWQMLLLRCPSRSLTIVGDRAQARHGFTRDVAGAARAGRSGPGDGGLAEHQLPHARGDHGRGGARHQGRPRRTPTCRPRSAARACRSAMGPSAIWAMSSTRGSRRTRPSPSTPRGSPASSALHEPQEVTARASARVRWLTPELAKGLEFDLVVLIDPDSFGAGIEGAVDRYVAMTRATQQLVILTSEAAPGHA